jgi:tripartite-type tricarboxylate transporter receptor subunit TctC
MLRWRTLALLLSAMTIVLFDAASALGQAYPAKPLRIVTVQPGGANDFEARYIAQGISGPLGQPVVVENRPSSLVAAETVSRSAPDGYTLLLGGTPVYTEQLFRSTGFNALTVLTPITTVVRKPPYVLLVHPSVPVKSVKDLIALARAKPGALNFAMVGVGGGPHLSAELFKSTAHIDIVGVSYKAAAQAILATLEGETHMTFADASASAPHMKSGRLRGLAVTSPEPSIFAPGLPTIADSGLPGYSISGIDNRLNQEIVRLLRTPRAREDFLKVAAEAIGNSPEELLKTMKFDIAQTSKLIKDAGITVDQ